MLARLFEGPIQHVARGLDHANHRHELLSQNIANLDTPGYQSRDLLFEEHLSPLLKRAAPAGARDVPAAGPDARPARVVYADDGPVKPNGNDVNVDSQMARLAENTLFHHTLTQILAGQFALLRQAISGRI